MCVLGDYQNSGPVIVTDDLGHSNSNEEIGGNHPGKVRESLPVIEGNGRGHIRNLGKGEHRVISNITSVL